MNSHNSKTENLGGNEPVQTEMDQEEPRVLKSTLVDLDKLSIVENYDIGGDPYNSTGQHVIIKSKTIIEE